MSNKTQARRLTPGPDRDKLAADLKKKYDSGGEHPGTGAGDGPFLRRRAPPAPGCRRHLPLPGRGPAPHRVLTPRRDGHRTSMAPGPAELEGQGSSAMTGRSPGGGLSPNAGRAIGAADRCPRMSPEQPPPLSGVTALRLLDRKGTARVGQPQAVAQHPAKCIARRTECPFAAAGTWPWSSRSLRRPRPRRPAIDGSVCCTRPRTALPSPATSSTSAAVTGAGQRTLGPASPARSGSPLRPEPSA